MNWYNPSDRSHPVITPQAEINGFLSKHKNLQDFGIADRFLMLLTGKDASSLQPEYSVKEESFPLPAFLGKHPLYTIQETPKISLVEKACSAPVAVDALETAIAMGCKTLFAFGLCGAVSEYQNIGDIIIPTEILREEGTSYHYALKNVNAEPNQYLLDCLTDFLKANAGELRISYGKTVSTDAVFRQTLKKELDWRTDGILGVDMEMSALLIVAQYHNIPAISMFVVSDKHELDENAHWHWGGETLEISRKKALSLFIEFIKGVKI